MTEPSIEYIKGYRQAIEDAAKITRNSGDLVRMNHPCIAAEIERRIRVLTVKDAKLTK